jgi:membrane-bound inhibitor of C-type lysozyme
MFNYLKLICSFLILLSCSDINPKESQVIELDLDNNTNGITIEEVIANLDNSGVVAIKKIEGSFAYYYSQDNIYKSIFDSDNKELEIKYHHYGNENVLDKNYLVLTSRAISASGSGVSLTYFTLFEHENLSVRNVDFFNSRFGVAEFIGDYDLNKELDFLKISGIEDDKFSVTIQVIGKELPPSSNNVLTTLKYLGEDKFE